MLTYHHETVLINGRHARVEDIVKERIEIHSEFERDTYEFIRQWLSEQINFPFQTSGSTGAPKHIAFTRAQIIQSAESTINALNLLSSDISLVCLNTKYVAGKMMLVRALHHNMPIIITEPSSNPLEKIDLSSKIDFAAFVPLQLETMLNFSLNDRFNNMRTIIVGGAPVNRSLEKKIKELHTNVFLTYGMTETLSHIALADVKKNPSLFKILPGIKIAQDERDCLIIEMPFIPEPVFTNDVVHLESHDSFRWLGRIDNVINSGGVKIYPEIVEQRLQEIFRRLNMQCRFFLTGMSDKTLGTKVTLFIEGSNDNDLRKRLEKEMNNGLSKFEIPRQIIFVDQFVYTPTGKINRQETIIIA